MSQHRFVNVGLMPGDFAALERLVGALPLSRHATARLCLRWALERVSPEDLARFALERRKCRTTAK